MNRFLTSSKDEILNFILSGSSLIDGFPLEFASEEAIQHFLALNEFDLNVQEHADRLLAIHNEAVGYIRSQLKTPLHEAVASPPKLTELFRMASSKDKTLRTEACAVLKTMNVIHHIDGRELLYNCSITPRELFSLAQDKIERQLSKMRLAGVPIVSYSGGRKPKESLITKLLSTRRKLATRLNDRIRYQIVTKTREDIKPLIIQLFEELLPINYLVPGGSKDSLFETSPLPSPKKSIRREEDEPVYSGTSYRVVRFMVDLPVNLNRYKQMITGPFSTAIGHITFCMVEFRIVDVNTEKENDAGENSREKYKTRQTQGVVQRIFS